MMSTMRWARKPLGFVVLLFATLLLLTACMAPKSDVPLPQEAIRSDRPRVLVTTDINIDRGDLDDRQSMAHLLMYADEVNLRGIIPYRFNAGGVEATLAAMDAYEQDYQDPKTQYSALGYPTPDALRSLIARNPRSARRLLLHEAQQASPKDPLYVLVWGDMQILREALQAEPAIADHLRVLSIGTHLKSPRANDCTEKNWNSGGRDDIYTDERFHHLWWVENDWTFEGMFWGDEPGALLDRLKDYGALGHHIWDVVQPYDWAHYFRAGDTPSLLYVLDPNHDLDDPTQGSWAGQFYQPFPESRPHYYTDVNGGVAWDYEDACRTWDQVETVHKARIQTLLDRREGMYEAFSAKLDRLYGRSK